MRKEMMIALMLEKALMSDYDKKLYATCVFHGRYYKEYCFENSIDVNPAIIKMIDIAKKKKENQP